MSTRLTPATATTLIPASWTPEQALAVFELLDELRDRVWATHGCHIQELLQQEQTVATRDLHSSEPTRDDPSF